MSSPFALPTLGRVRAESATCMKAGSGVGRHRGGRAGAMSVLLGCMASAHATSQCPADFGPKDPLVDLLGWAVIVTGGVLGAGLCVHVVRRARGLRRWRRVAVVLAGVGAMLLLWIGGLVLAIASFFLRC